VVTSSRCGTDGNPHHRGRGLRRLPVGNPPKIAKAAFRQALSIHKGARYKREDYVTPLKLIYDILMKIRKEGLLAIEATSRSPKRARCSRSIPVLGRIHHMVVFITDCLRLIVGGKLGSARAREPARVRTRDASQGSARAAHAVQKVATRCRASASWRRCSAS
jgi:chemotaxis protein MotA